MNLQSENSTAHNDELGTIWAVVEARKSFPALIVITGATDRDDTAAVGRGLAQVAHDDGQRVGYLDFRADGRAVAGPRSYAELSTSTRPTKREAFDAALATWRTLYDVVIVDIATARSGALAAHIASVGDGVVIGVCAERRVVAADRELATLLAQLHASVIGVVWTAAVAKAAGVAVSPDRSRLSPAAQP